MKVAIIGPGAIGCTLGFWLSRGGLDVMFLDLDAASAAALERAGLHIEGVRGEFRAAARATADAASAGPADLVVVSVKAYDTAAAMRQHAAVAGPGATVVTFQNGTGNVEAIGAVVGADRVLAGTTTLGAHLLGVGHVRHAGDGDTFLGEPGGGSSERAERIAAALTAGGIATRAVPDMPQRLWSKLAVSTGINALTAILRVRNGALVEDADADAVLEAAARETVEVARARGIALDPTAAVERTREVARRSAANRSSMFADVLAGRRTEIDAINGAVARLGRECGVPTPVNDVLARLIRSIGRCRPGHT